MNKKIILIIIAVVIILIIIAAIILFQKDEPNLNLLSPDKEKTNEEIILEIEEKEKKQVDPIAILKSRLGLQARSFMARYGTYSSDNMYGNLKTLLPQMSTRFAQETSKKISLKEETQGFVSLTTKVLNFNLEEFNEESKIIFIGQIQEQEVNNGKTSLNQRDIEIIFIKENDQWKIDDVIYRQ